MAATKHLVGGLDAEALSELPLDANRRLMHLRHAQIRIALNATAWQDLRLRTVERIRIPGIENQQIAHRHAVDAQRLVVEVRRIPVVEQAVAAADGGATSPWCCRESKPRHQIQLVVDV